jgi:quercetin dioxygenase-like cupin family protein
MKREYTDKFINPNTRIRRITKEAVDGELTWHRDASDRVVTVLEGSGWKLQFDNQIPFNVEPGDRISVQANAWHRVIPGSGDLVMEIKEMSDIRDQIAEMVQEVVLEIAEGRRKLKALPRSYSAPKGSEREKDLRRHAKMHPDDPDKYDHSDVAGEKGPPRDAPRSKYTIAYEKRFGKSKVDEVDEAEPLDIDADDTPEELGIYELNDGSELYEDADDGLLLALLEEADEKGRMDPILEQMLNEKLGAKTMKSLRAKAEKSNAPVGALTAVYKKGLAAYGSGHRRKIGQHQWAMARVNSFLVGGKARSVDSKEWERVKKHRKKKR